jgi:hypothetical protein
MNGEDAAHTPSFPPTLVKKRRLTKFVMIFDSLVSDAKDIASNRVWAMRFRIVEAASAAKPKSPRTIIISTSVKPASRLNPVGRDVFDRR